MMKIAQVLSWIISTHGRFYLFNIITTFAVRAKGVRDAMTSVTILIPTFDRPEILETTLPSWLKAKQVNRIFLLAEGSSLDILNRYKSALRKYQKDNKLVYLVTFKRGGSVRARNALLDMAAKHGCTHLVMVDDDHFLTDENCIEIMAKNIESDNIIGAVGGKTLSAKQHKVDPSFFLDLPINLADSLTKITSYIFLDTKHGSRYAEALSSFFMVRGDLLDATIRYDEIFNTPTGFREESDFQLQIKQAGYKLLHEPRAYVVHLAPSGGGNRPRINMRERIYWKARNHTVFVLKWNVSNMIRVWYLILSALILMLYRPWHMISIFAGMRDGYTRFFKAKRALRMHKN